MLKNLQNLPVNLKRVARAARKSLRVEGFDKPAEISIVLTNDEGIRALNQKYCGIDRPTDVLAFSQLEGNIPTLEGVAVPIGDVVISVETAARQASQLGHSLDKEIEILVVHGILHLLGYEDNTEHGSAVMCLKGWNILRGGERK